MSDAKVPGPNFLEKLQSLASSPSAADFTIACSGKSFPVSRAVVRLHSGYFATLFDSNWTANKDSCIDLKDDDLGAIQAMIEYFGHFDYGGRSRDDLLNYISLDGESESNAEIKLTVEVLLHTKVWAVADKYDVPDLKIRACGNFERDCSILLAYPPHGTKRKRDVGQSASECWFAAVGYIYAHSSPADPGLRAAVVRVWSSGISAETGLFNRESWQRLMEKYPELGVDMVLGVGNKATARKKAVTEDQRLRAQKRIPLESLWQVDSSPGSQ